MDYLTACFLGTRKIDPMIYDHLMTVVSDTIIELVKQDVSAFKVGGANGIDYIAAYTVLFLRKHYPYDTRFKNIQLHLVLPYPNHEAKLSLRSKRIYEDIRDKADRIEYASDSYNTYCYIARNNQMIEDSDICVYYVTNSNTIVRRAINYARQRGVSLVDLAQKLSEDEQGL